MGHWNWNSEIPVEASAVLSQDKTETQREGLQFPLFKQILIKICSPSRFTGVKYGGDQRKLPPIRSKNARLESGITFREAKRTKPREAKKKSALIRPLDVFALSLPGYSSAKLDERCHEISRDRPFERSIEELYRRKKRQQFVDKHRQLGFKRGRSELVARENNERRRAAILPNCESLITCKTYEPTGTVDQPFKLLRNFPTSTNRETKPGLSSLFFSFLRTSIARG